MDVRLTQGGEPTFVSVDDREGGEWNTEAMGPTKRALSGELMERLRAHYGSGGLVHYGQGKWYPGEQLPRWSLNLFWRRDGVPIWRDPALMASERDDHGATAAKAREFLHRLALRLGVDRRNVFAGYEDLGYYLWREGKLPINVEPTDSRVADKAERNRLRQVFERGLGEPVGYALPIAVDEQHPKRWRSTPWYLRNDHCFLVAGDSPLGFRLPLDSLPWARAADLPWIYPPDANVDLPPLRRRPGEAAAGDAAGVARFGRDRRAEVGRARDAERHARGRQRRRGGARQRGGAPEVNESAGFVVRTAISAEARHGRLYIFMPPTSALEDYLALVAAVEATAKAMRLPVTLEGYEPPTRSAPRAAARDAGPGRDRGQRQPGVGVERAGRADDASLRAPRARRA